MRQLLNNYGYHLAGAIVVVAVLALWLGMRSKPLPVPTYEGNQDLAFFVDESSGAESVHPADQIPPLPGSDGTDSVVIAVKFKADTEKEAKTWYLVKYPVQVRDRVQGMANDDLDRMNQLESSRLVRAVEKGSPWMAVNDPAAAAVITIPEASPGHPRKPVFPARQ